MGVMAQGAKAVASEVELLRRTLSKKRPEALVDGELIRQALELLSTTTSSPLEALSLLLIVLRQLRACLQLSSPVPANLIDTCDTLLRPGFMPNGMFAALCFSSVLSGDKTQTLRSLDCLDSAGQLKDLLPAPQQSSSSQQTTDFLVPLFRDILSRGASNKANLKIIAVLVNHVPISIVPDILLHELLDGLELIDLAGLRSQIIVDILVRRRHASTLNEDDHARDYGSREKRLDAEMIQHVMPLFDINRPPVVLTNLARYLLHALFKRFPSTNHTILKSLAWSETLSIVHDRLPQWLTVASLGVSSGLIDLRSLPSSDLEDAMTHSSPDVRIQAFQLLAGSKDLLRDDTLTMIRTSLEYNETLPGGGSRSELASTFFAFLTRVKTLEDGRRKSLARKIQQPTPDSDTALESAQAFHHWFTREFTIPRLDLVHARPIALVLLILNLLGLYVEVFGDQLSIQQLVFSAEMVELLFACQSSEFSEARWRARAIMGRATIPLPAYESINSPKVVMLLRSALDSINHPRKVQAEAGHAALTIIFERLIRDTNGSLKFVTEITDKLERHVEVAERDLVESLYSHPLHGLISAVKDLLGCLDLRDPASQVEWTPLFHRLERLVRRIWKITQRVVSLAPTVRANGNGTDQDNNVAAHEIARAYEVLGEGDEGDEEESLDHTDLVSGCWRATREISDLLSTLFTIPVSHKSDGQCIWNVDEIDTAGRLFLLWLHEVRHRGTFSRIATSFGTLVEVSKRVPSYAPLCDKWLEDELDIITTDTLSTTRRSAALPYSILALIAGDTRMLKVAFDRLVELARVDSPSSDTTKVHAFNILKIVLLDAKQTKLLDTYFERAFMTSIKAFDSANWNVRNVGLIVSSTLIHRSLSPQRGGQDYYVSRAVLSSRQTLWGWNAKFPTIVPFIISVLDDLTGSPSSLASHATLFPLLIILRSLQWTEKAETLATRVRQAVRPFLASQEVQVRMVAAQAMSSLLSPDDAMRMMLLPAIGNIKGRPMTQNAVHGALLLRRHIITDVIDWPVIERRFASLVAQTFIEDNRLLRSRQQHSLVCQAMLDCLAALSASLKHNDGLRNVALNEARRHLTNSNIFRPGFDCLIESCGLVLVDHGAAEDVQLMLRGHDDLQLLALERLRAGSKVSSEVSKRVIELILNDDTDDFVRIAGLELAMSDSIAASALMEHAATFGRLAHGSSNAQVREAALPVYARSASATPPSEESLATLSHALLAAADEGESQPSRMTAVLALTSLASVIVPAHGATHPTATGSLAILHQVFLRLLQDDDEAIRHQAIGILSKALGRRRSVVHGKALELWWNWLYDFLSSRDDSANAQWTTWLWSLALDHQDHVHDIRQLRQANDKAKENVVLFELEAPNLFRDPIIDCRFAAALLAKLSPEDAGQYRNRLLHTHQEVETALSGLPDLAPIDALYAVRSRVRRRLAAQAVLLPGKGSESKLT